jgi:limonene-1,2-epoxide hydrolase
MFKATFFKLIFAVSLIFQIEGAQPVNSTENLSKHFIERVFKEVIEDLNANEKIISQYFSPHYIQHVDGHQLNYEDFVQHMVVQKSLLDSIKVCIEHCVIEGNAICTVHRVDAIKKNGEKIAVKVIAYFEVENKKIILCDELTHLLEGDEKNQNIGSIK